MQLIVVLWTDLCISSEALLSSFRVIFDILDVSLIYDLLTHSVSFGGWLYHFLMTGLMISLKLIGLHALLLGRSSYYLMLHQC